jgi:hypothetical protein
MKKQLAFGGCLICLIISIFFLAAKKPAKAENPPPLKITSAAVFDTLSLSQQDSIPEVITAPSSAGEVTFPHRLHYEDFEVECKTCHHEINASRLKFPHEDYFDDFWIDCKICHHEGGTVSLSAQPCSKCHHKRPMGIADETLSSKVVIHKNCWECHEIGTGGEATTNCKLCHSGPRTEPKINSN